MADKLICVLRRPSGLVAVMSHRREEFVPPKPVPDDRSEVDPYLEECRLFAELDRHWPRVLAEVRESWDSLGHVAAFDAQTLFHVLNVLIHTLPEADTPDIPPLGIVVPPAAVQPTAAHPRAYRGTKTKPPKLKRLAAIDLRPHLCVARDVNHLLARLEPFLGKARDLLERADLSPERFPRLTDKHGRVIDPYLQYCHAAGGRSIHDLPANFRTHLLFWLRGLPWSAVAEALSLYWGLNLEMATNAPLLRCFARFLAACPLRDTLEWGRVLLLQPVPRRTAFAELLVEASVQGRAPSERLSDIIGEIDRMSPDHVYRHRQYTLLSSLWSSTDLDYLVDGFRLADRYRPDNQFADVGHCDGFAIETVTEFVEHVHTTDAPWRASYALTLWETCARLEGFARFLEHRPWKGLEPDVAYEAINMFAEVTYHDIADEARQVKWRTLRDLAPRLFKLVRDVEPCYQEKAVHYLRDLVWYWDDPESLRRNLDRYRRLLPRLCRKPFAQETTPDTLTSLTELGPREWDELMACDGSCFLKLERESRRENNARLIARGLHVLTEEAGAWTVRALRKCPSQLLRSAQVLGCMGSTARRQVVQRWLLHPLTTLDAERTPVEQLVGEIDHLRPPGVHNPVPRTLRNSVKRLRQLNTGQIERARRGLLEELVATRVDLLHRLALEQLACNIGPAPDTAEARHALCLQGFISDNRRTLRRFLRAYFRGQRAYLTDHPVNRDWLARHAHIDSHKWLQGIERTRTLSDSSKVRLSIEQNPLEVLRLGTHMGTCLGLGGNLADSAAAIALDINKRVVFARDSSGRILARQLVALAENDRLVCFAVYPLESSSHLRQAFADYDRGLAEALNVEIHDPKTKDEYQIALLLSNYWWDDEAWDGGEESLT